LLVHDVASGEQRRIELPAGARVGAVSWSHTSKWLAFTLVRDDGVDLGTCAVESTQPHRVAQNVNALFGGFDWMPDGSHLLVELIPEGRGARPAAPSVPSGPTTMESSGRKSPARTLQDLLRDE